MNENDDGRGGLGFDWQSVFGSAASGAVDWARQKYFPNTEQATPDRRPAGPTAGEWFSENWKMLAGVLAGLVVLIFGAKVLLK